MKPCSHFIFTTVSPENGQKHPVGEPLATLQRFRTDEKNGDVDFGQNLIARSGGVIRVGDRVDILTRKPAKKYTAGPENIEAAHSPGDKKPTILNIIWKDRSFSGNNQHILLEQLEQQGIRIPYSCRAGICGHCRIRLLKGDVKALKQNAIGEDGTILCCSCIPATPSAKSVTVLYCPIVAFRVDDCLRLESVIHNFNRIA